MRRRKKVPQSSGNEWLLTYSDLVTLLLVFFVMLYAFSRVDIVKFQGFVASFQGVGILNDGPGVMDQTAPAGEQGVSPTQSIVEQNAAKGEAEKMFNNVRDYLQDEGLSGKVDVSIQKAGIALEIKEKILFDSGQAVLKPEARKLLDQLSGLFEKLPNQVSVEGHTDDRNINTVQYPTNWELSVDRSVKVIRYLTEDCGLDPRKFVAVGYGEFSPLAPNNAPKNRAENRRVVIIIKNNEVSSEVSGN